MPEVKQDIQKTESGAPEGVERTGTGRVYRPDVDIIEREDGIVLLADMPGVDEKSLEVTLEDRILTIDGKVSCAPPEGFSALSAEYGEGDYQRVFSLSEEIDEAKIEATLKNGVLRLVMPRAEALKARKIEISKAG